MQQNGIVPFNAYAAVEMVKQLRLAVDILRGSGELVAGIDYGRIPGTGDKDTLLLPGMEKLCRALNAVPEYLEAYVVRDYQTPLFHYEYICTLRDVDTGALISGGRGLGLCNSMETSFAWRWVNSFEVPEELKSEPLMKRGGRTSEFEFAINKAETSGKYGKPAEYWQAFKDAVAAGTAVEGTRETARGMSKTWEIDTTVYRIPNPDVFDQVNAIMKRAKKRALGDAIKGAANVSAYFTVDMEDFVPGAVVDPDMVDGTFTVVKNAPHAPPVSQGATQAPPAQNAPTPASGAQTGNGERSEALDPNGAVSQTMPPTQNGQQANGGFKASDGTPDADGYRRYLVHEIIVNEMGNGGRQYVAKSEIGDNIVVYGGDAFGDAGYDTSKWQANSRPNRLVPPCMIEAKFDSKKWDIRSVEAGY